MEYIKKKRAVESSRGIYPGRYETILAPLFKMIEKPENQELR